MATKVQVAQSGLSRQDYLLGSSGSVPHIWCYQLRSPTPGKTFRVFSDLKDLDKFELKDFTAEASNDPDFDFSMLICLNELSSHTRKCVYCQVNLEKRTLICTNIELPFSTSLYPLTSSKLAYEI